jgi:hypothetical protein
MYSKIKSIDFDKITLESDDTYKVQSRSDIVAWSPGDSVEVSGYTGDVTIKNTSRFKTVRARKW